MGVNQSNEEISSNNSLQIITSTWMQQSHGLYDFTENNIDKRYSILNIKGSTNIYRLDNNILGSKVD